MRKFLPVVALSLLSSCISSRYFLVSHDELKQDIATYGSLPAKRYLILPSEYPIVPMPFLQEEPSKTVINFLRDKKLEKAKKHISLNSYENKNSIIFASAIISLYEGNYDSCSFYIREMDEFSKNCFVQFILVDCEYENERNSGNVDYKAYISKYQSVLDCANDDNLHKELVKSRLKLIRYGY